ncbi:hypothetical protein [Moheibacter sediminis]|uniref:DinB family protein n=1 Tax=Moheibacter sediminis TaxID=1434700 RepID=A0A1W2ARP9_9FLAO|nr:hypothetical protein [Moheibacter sediminis]SMC63264.1 hypothetical protein SAMN06296427_10527 [Moheibacter sediminis]
MKNVSRNLLSEIKILLSELGDNDYSKNLSILNGNSIGKHVRHILDLFECLLDFENGIVNYDERKRNIETEVNKDIALQKVQSIISDLEKLDIEKKVILIQKLNDSFCEINSSIERELLYNIEHCVHHLAIIRIGIENNFDYVKIPENFGVAHSTISHREQMAG